MRIAGDNANMDDINMRVDPNRCCEEILLVVSPSCSWLGKNAVLISVDTGIVKCIRTAVRTGATLDPLITAKLI